MKKQVIRGAGVMSLVAGLILGVVLVWSQTSENVKAQKRSDPGQNDNEPKRQAF